jgi:hypothetical protein
LLTIGAHQGGCMEGIDDASVVPDVAVDLPADGVVAVSEGLARWGGWAGAAARAEELVDDGALAELAFALTREAVRPAEAAAAFHALVDAVAACTSPMLFGEVVEVLLADELALPLVAEHLSEVCLPLARPAPGASLRGWLLAADALEVVVRVALGGWVDKFGVLFALTRLPAEAPPAYARPALRCLSASYEQWREPALVTALERLAGLDPARAPDSAGTQDGVEWRSQVEPDAAYELGCVALLQALTADAVAEAEGYLIAAERRFAMAAAEGREDAAAYGDVVTLLRTHLPTGHGLALWATVDLRALSVRLERAVREHVLGSACLEHWRSPRLDAEVAWVGLAQDVATAAAAIEQPSWYQVERVLGDVLAAWSASRCSRVLSKADQEGVQAILGPAIESGIAAQAGLMRHLEDHIGHLEGRLLEPAGAEDVSCAAATPDAAAAEELSACRALLNAARKRLTSPEPRPKALRWEVGSAWPEEPLPLLTRLTGGAADALSMLSPSVARRLEGELARGQAATIERSSPLVIEGTFDELRGLLASCPDYGTPAVQHAVDQLLMTLLRFWRYVSGMSASQMPWLHKAEAKEQDLHDELFRFLHAAGLGQVTKREVPDIGGGRVDIVCSFNGFELVLEMKKDASVTSPVKGKYVLQAASYQAADVPVGFLVVLGLAKLPSMPHLRSCFDVQVLTDPALGVPRYVVTVLVPGNRTSPSASTTSGMVSAAST